MPTRRAGGPRVALELIMSVAEMRLRHDATLKRFLQNAEFIRHLLRAQPLSSLDEAEIAWR